MDFFAHLLWAYIVYGKLVPFQDLLQSMAFTVAPDFVWGIPVFAEYLRRKSRGKIVVFRTLHEDWKDFKAIYYFSHSFVLMVLLFILTSVLASKFYLPVLYGWGLHILLDMFLHKGSLGNKPLYPFLQYKINGFVHWSDKRVLILNWILIAAFLLVIYILF